MYEPGSIGVAQGDAVRITQNGQCLDGHKLNNGALYRIKKFTRAGDLVLDNGWVVGRDFAHLTHGYCTTSHASQGKTVDQVFIAQGSESFPASSHEQFYVSVSRGREKALIYTDDKSALRRRIQDSGARASATELVEGQVTARMQLIDLAAVRRERAARQQRHQKQWQKGVGDMEQHPPLRLVEDWDRQHAGVLERERHVGAAIER